MSDQVEEVWSGWKLIKVPEGAGGAEARHRQHLINRRRHQMAVLELLQKAHPGLVRGQYGVKVLPETTQQWEETLQTTDSGSVVEMRNKINFLSLGLRRGQQELGWEVVVPAPLHLVRPAASVFTPSSFEAMSYYRDWCRYADYAIQQADFQALLLHDNADQGHRRFEPEMISWGLFLYCVMTRDSLLGTKFLNSLPLATSTLAVYKSFAWLVLHEMVPGDMPGKVPPRSRWHLGVSTLAVLMRHIEQFGHPGEKVNGYQQAKMLTKTSWLHFCRAIGAKALTLSECQEHAATAFRLHVPAYLVNSALGKQQGTSLAEARWQQLLCGGYRVHAKQEANQVSDEATVVETGLPPMATKQLGRDQPLYEGRKLLKLLHDILYKRREEKRLGYGQLARELENAVTASQQMAPIVECLCRWLLFLHRTKKRKQSTLYKYLGISMPLLQAMGDTLVDQDRLAILVEAYQCVVEQAKTEKNRSYRWTVLRSFHTFLVADLGLANVYMEFSGDGAAVSHHADANCLSEEEYRQVSGYLASQAASAMGAIRYWIFVLGFRAGLRIGEALSIQLDDILLNQMLEHTDVTLLIRNNAYVAIKSHDSRRQLPLHYLLTETELDDFKAFVIKRHSVATHGRVMLFGEGGNSVSPLRDDIVQTEIHTGMRRITGDPSLRFHHLRHSLANYLLLSFHGVEVPWPVPQHHAALWEKVVNGPSRSGLYFIAQVMGHASPEVTLRSYLHFNCLLSDHYCHQKSNSVEGSLPSHAIAQLEALDRLIEVKSATLRKWQERFGERPPLWLQKAFPMCPLIDVEQQDVMPYPALPDKVLLERQGLSELSLEQIAAALDLLHKRSFEDVERIFNLRDGEAEGLISCAVRVLTARTRQGKSAFRHYRLTKGKQPAASNSAPPRFPMPHSLAERPVAYAMYQAIWSQWFEHHPDVLRKHLRFFYRYHRATDGHVWIRDVDDGLDFVSWVVSLDAGVKAVIEVIPSALSSLPAKKQLSEWKKRLPSHYHKVEWQLKSMGSRFNKPLGTGNVKFYVVNQNKRSHSGYPARYVLVLACIVMAAVARHEQQNKPLQEKKRIRSL
ncbi:DNA breaking-rejoining enzyme, catalytic core [Halomonas sp. FeN2]|uniref:DNA breaking-rejoining enzyme, catalytic core n=1 Tax=Vreelandella aquamarina TaxID=77097 RepID=A0A857GJ42_9GAMM|nr:MULTISPECIES: DNA breaking-rejoining enzyme, catalytic core [Halomonas]QHD48574.1 DNA breaking-rejoining enzyme, catalytic core [Halomonas meridiana]UBR48389.1 DNA breaking-rejoining enzyme, catalytic core [Halomonas sp. FeN2]